MHVDVRELVADILENAIATQQPFHTALLNQIAGIESRQSKQAGDLMTVRDLVHMMVQQELKQRVDGLQNQVNTLLDERNQRIGVIKATEWVPKALGWLAFIIFAIVAYYEVRIKGN